MTLFARLPALLITLSLAGCPSPASRHVFFGLDEAEPLDPPAAERLYAEGNALWARRATGGNLVEAIKRWQTASIKDHKRADVLLALSKGYAADHVAKGSGDAAARKRTCYNGWKVSSQALEITSPAFARRVRRDSAEVAKVWKDALALVEEGGAAALYWYAHYYNCMHPDGKRIKPALARVKALKFEPAEDARWPDAL